MADETDRAELSVVIASWNSWTYLDPCLASLRNTGIKRLEILIVDNASSDDTLTLLKVKYPEAILIANRTNRGHCPAINQGITAATGDFVMVLDADTVLQPDSATQLLRFLRANPGVSIAAPRMLNPDGTIQETARSFPSAINGILGRQSKLTRFFPKNKYVKRYMRSEQLSSTAPFEVDWVSAACMVFPRSVPARVGLWDEGFKGYWVDADWCRAAHDAGKVYCVPNARVVHFEQNRSGRKKGANRIMMFHTGAHRFFRKHRGIGVLDPRSIAVGMVLGARAAALLAVDAFRRPNSGSSYGKPRNLRLEE